MSPEAPIVAQSMLLVEAPHGTTWDHVLVLIVGASSPRAAARLPLLCAW
jgi:hypothetical protein